MEARAPLSKGRVIEAAVELADEVGLESLSMRKLANKLDVEAMSIYYHVANKDEILDGIIEYAVGEVDLGAGPDWRSTIRDIAVSVNRTLRSHPWASTLWMGRITPGPLRLRYMDTVLGTFAQGGFSPQLTHHAFHAFENHVIGFALQAGTFPFEPEELADVGAAFLATLPGHFPHLIEHVRQHLEPTPDGVTDFEFGLDLLLDGLEGAKNRN
jgi:AcrR family transcriptional regulator